MEKKDVYIEVVSVMGLVSWLAPVCQFVLPGRYLISASAFPIDAVLCTRGFV